LTATATGYDLILAAEPTIRPFAQPVGRGGRALLADEGARMFAAERLS